MHLCDLGDSVCQSPSHRLRSLSSATASQCGLENSVRPLCARSLICNTEGEDSRTQCLESTQNRPGTWQCHG